MATAWLPPWAAEVLGRVAWTLSGWGWAAGGVLRRVGGEEGAAAVLFVAYAGAACLALFGTFKAVSFVLDRVYAVVRHAVALALVLALLLVALPYLPPELLQAAETLYRASLRTAAAAPVPAK